MALRITQGLMYSSFVSNMNRTLGAYMESNIQASSQKKVNRPSDDPVGAGRILAARATLDKMGTFTENIKTSTGWLSTMDGVLQGEGSVLDILSRLKVLAEDGASGDNTAENRLEMSFEIRQLFEQLIGVANTTYAGQHLFAGHKTDQAAYREGLAATCLEGGSGTIADATFNVTDGKLTRTMVVQVTDGGADGTFETATFRYSVDGGQTWVENVQAVNGVLEMAGVHVAIDDPTRTVTVVDTANLNSNDNGTWLYIRPTAIYQGDDHDLQVSNAYRPAGSTHAYDSSDPTQPNYLGAEGNFPRDVAVRLDTIDAGPPPLLHYSYSLDDGSNWTQANVPYPANAADEVSLPVPGGYVKLGERPDNTDMGMQFIVHPHRADIYMQIGDDSTIAVNLVGKDVFGGLYDYPRDGLGYPVTVPGDGNLFEIVGNLLAAAETNSQQGMQEGLAALDNAMAVVRTRVAEVGGRVNRLEATYGAMLTRQYAEEDHLSEIEDVDVTELMTRLAQQQVAYNSVLKSSSMIMQMSLVNFL